MTDTGDRQNATSETSVEQLGLGKTVYDDNGNALGEIRGFDHAGFYVTMRKGYEALSVEHVRAGKEFGEAELMWRCIECGEMGKIEEGIPDSCPNCGEPRESLMYWTED